MPERLSSSYNNSKSSVIETESTTTTKDEGLEIQKKITLATEGFTTSKFCELVLRDRSRLSGENALTISEYIMALKREINPRLSTIKNTIQFLSELSKSVGIEKRFEDMTSNDVLLFLDRNRKSENDDPLHKWIGSYNAKPSVLFRFFQMAILSKGK